MYLVNFMDSLSSSDAIFYILMIVLTMISVILFYLIYSQNKELVKSKKEKSEAVIKQVEEKTIPLEVKEVESLERPSIIEPTSLDIPEPLELTQSIYLNSDTTELQNITKELEKAPKDRNVEMTAYEAEQEEKAIISYDELVKHSKESNEEDIVEDNDKVSEFEIKNNNDDTFEFDDLYRHEEGVLKALKELNNLLGK